MPSTALLMLRNPQRLANGHTARLVQLPQAAKFGCAGCLQTDTEGCQPYKELGVSSLKLTPGPCRVAAVEQFPLLGKHKLARHGTTPAAESAMLFRALAEALALSRLCGLQPQFRCFDQKRASWLQAEFREKMLTLWLHATQAECDC